MKRVSIPLTESAHAALEALQLKMRKPDGFKPSKAELLAQLLEAFIPAALQARELERLDAATLTEGDRYAADGVITVFTADGKCGLSFSCNIYPAEDFEKIVQDSGLFP